MNLDLILGSLETSGQFGHIISSEESLVLYNSLLILQNENHFRRIFFWGKIFGAEKDYYVAYGYTRDALHGRIYYYSMNCVKWGLLPQPTKNGLMLTPLCSTKFQGLLNGYSSQEPFTYQNCLPNSVIKSPEKIIGGEEVIPHTYSFVVRLEMLYPSPGYLSVCGGSLISPSWVLTAAHCLTYNGQKPIVMKALLGVHNIMVKDEFVDVFSVNRIIPHQHFGVLDVKNDIGLVKLQTPAILNKNISIITYEKRRRKIYTKLIGTAFGWGNTWQYEGSEGDSSTQTMVLLKVSSPILTEEECALFFERGIISPESHICMSGTSNIGICTGDSGGPLVVEGVLVGVSSFVRKYGRTLCILETPSVFTKVPYYQDWIEYTINKNASRSNRKFYGSITISVVIYLFSSMFNSILGDPSLVIDILIEKDETLIPEKRKQPQIKKLKEEDRLATTIHLITEEAAVIPRAALFKRPDGVIVENISFEGLDTLEAREIKSFLHLRKPTQKWNTNLLTRDDYNYAMDFLDPLDIDIPEGCWMIQITAAEDLVILKSVYWPGMIFFHYLRTPRHGFVYFGHGKKCMDLPFMLSPFFV